MTTWSWRGGKASRGLKIYKIWWLHTWARQTHLSTRSDYIRTCSTIYLNGTRGGKLPRRPPSTVRMVWRSRLWRLSACCFCFLLFVFNDRVTHHKISKVCQKPSAYGLLQRTVHYGEASLRQENPTLAHSYVDLSMYLI